MQFLQPMHQQPCVSHHQQVARVETHRVYPGGFPFGCWRGMIMEDDHDLDLQIFRNNPNCNWEVSSSYKLQLPSAALSIPISPSPKSQVPSPKSQVQEARRPWTPWCPLVLHQQHGHHSFMLPYTPTGSTGCPLCPTGVLIDPVAAVLLDLIGCWFPLRRLKLICSSPGVKSTCTLIYRVDLDSADGVRAHNFWMYCILLFLSHKPLSPLNRDTP